MEFFFRLNLSFEAFKPYYQGVAEAVEVRDSQGKILWINGRHFRHFLTSDGVRGRFRLVLDNEGKFKSLERLP